MRDPFLFSSELRVVFFCGGWFAGAVEWEEREEGRKVCGMKERIRWGWRCGLLCVCVCGGCWVLGACTLGVVVVVLVRCCPVVPECCP